MLWAMPTVNGLKKAAANPAAAPRNGIDTPTIESYPSCRARGMKMMMKGITSSDMPKIEPASEKTVMRAGIRNTSRCGRSVMA